MRDPLLCLVAPEAGNGRASARLDALLEATPALAARTRTERVASMEDAVRAMTAAPDATPVAVGGDGTVNLVARALRASRPPAAAMALLPFGTGNAFAHALGIGTVGRAVAALRSSSVRRVDVMVTGHRAAPLALVSISLGIESAFMARLLALRTRSRTFGALAGLAGAWRAQATPHIALDGRPWLAGERVRNAGLYLQPAYFHGLVVWPDATGDDGLGEALACRTRSAYLRTLVAGARTAVPGDDGVRRWRRWSTAEIATDAPVQIDGDVVPAATFGVRVERAALAVRVPDSTR